MRGIHEAHSKIYPQEEVTMPNTKDPRLERAGVSVKQFPCTCPSCGEVRYFKRKTLANRAEKLKTVCKSCTAKKNIKRYNGKIEEEHGVRLSWLKTYEVGAKARGLVFDISAKDVSRLYEEQEGLCALSGLPILLPPNSRYKDVTASIDRIDNQKGYLKNNIQLVHKKINMLRGKYDVEDFIEMCKLVAEYN